MPEAAYPCLYQINTRVWMGDLARDLRRPATLDDIPNSELDRIAGMGFDWVWFLSVWQTGQRTAPLRTNPGSGKNSGDIAGPLRRTSRIGFRVTG
jgi:hypothetical protein